MNPDDDLPGAVPSQDQRDPAPPTDVALGFLAWSRAAAEMSVLEEDERNLLLDELGLTRSRYATCERFWVSEMLRLAAAGAASLAKAHAFHCVEAGALGKAPILRRLFGRAALAIATDDTLPFTGPGIDALPFQEGDFSPPAPARRTRSTIEDETTLGPQSTRGVALPFVRAHGKP